MTDSVVYEKALEYFQKAADMGFADAQNALGVMYFYGYGVERSDEKAMEYYRLAADQGLGKALFNLGVAYEWGYGVDQDYEKAMEYYRQAADQGSTGALVSIGYLYDQGLGVDQSAEKAALNMLTMTLHNWLKDEPDINIFCLHPGWIAVMVGGIAIAVLSVVNKK